jgi:hypothetical protein
MPPHQGRPTLLAARLAMASGRGIPQRCDIEPAILRGGSAAWVWTRGSLVPNEAIAVIPW